LERLDVKLETNETLTRARSFWAAYSQDKAAVGGLAVVVALSIVAILGPSISPYAPSALVGDILSPPGVQHWFGTDGLGRDMLSRMISGTRVTMLFALGAAGVSLFLGVLLGAIPGYWGGLIDDLLSRVSEVFIIIPTLFLLILITSVLGTNLVFTMLVVGITIWPVNAKITRAQVLTLKSRQFVLASRAAGASSLSVLFRHIIPNGLFPVIANSTLQMGYAILAEASLSFLGLGDVTQPSWGQAIYVSRAYFQYAWWTAVIPGMLILIAVLAFNLVGDGISTALNPRMRPQ
jgi:peptide/nickel transport system permease protein